MKLRVGANSSAVENPEKNVPIAVLSGTLLAGIMYTLSTAIIGGTYLIRNLSVQMLLSDLLMRQ